jgi:3-hydroxyisobutyrate dehydrogenase-like beta-hydroxyacid dehydrogenase
MTAPARVGLLGLENMGGQMARRLASAGHAVTGYDVDPARAQNLAPHGVAAAGSPAAVAGACDVLLSSLPDPAAVRGAYLGSKRDRQ